MTSEAYVFIDGLEDTPVICGVTRIKDNGKPGQFRYGKSYLGRPDAFPLDPINLPLSDEVFSTSARNGLFGALTDAGADSWGEKVILSLHKTKPKINSNFYSPALVWELVRLCLACLNLLQNLSGTKIWLVTFPCC